MHVILYYTVNYNCMESYSIVSSGFQHPWGSTTGWNMFNGRATHNVHIRNVSLHLTLNCTLHGTLAWIHDL